MSLDTRIGEVLEDCLKAHIYCASVLLWLFVGYSKTSLLSLSFGSRIGELREVMADIAKKQCDQDQYDPLSKDYM